MNGWHLLSGNAGSTSSHQRPLIDSPASPCHCCSIIEMIVALEEITVLTGLSPELFCVLFYQNNHKGSESPVYLVLWRATVE